MLFSNRSRIVVAGIGTDVGKTVTSAILMNHFQADYWKPIECGTSDTQEIKNLIDLTKHKLFKPAYSFKSPVSPHLAARMENTIIDPFKINPPVTSRPLIIEMAGGLFVPISENLLTFDLFKSWGGNWVVVSRHYLGSLNHTLLTLEILKQHQIPVLGLIFNGKPNEINEKAVLNISNIPFIGRILPEKDFNPEIIQGYAAAWQFGTPIPK